MKLKYAHYCTFCDAVKYRTWRDYDVIDEYIENGDEGCEHEWSDGERI